MTQEQELMILDYLTRDEVDGELVEVIDDNYYIQINEQN